MLSLNQFSNCFFFLVIHEKKPLYHSWNNEIPGEMANAAPWYDKLDMYSTKGKEKRFFVFVFLLGSFVVPRSGFFRLAILTSTKTTTTICLEDPSFYPGSFL